MTKKWEITEDFIVLTDSKGSKTNYSKPIFKHVAQSSNGNYFKNMYNLSQDEIDQLIQEMSINKPKEEQLEFEMASGFNWYGNEKPKEAEKKCTHEWLEYLGFNVDKFEYCKHCGEKKV